MLRPEEISKTKSMRPGSSAISFDLVQRICAAPKTIVGCGPNADVFTRIIGGKPGFRWYGEHTWKMGNSVGRERERIMRECRHPSSDLGSLGSNIQGDCIGILGEVTICQILDENVKSSYRINYAHKLLADGPVSEPDFHIKHPYNTFYEVKTVKPGQNKFCINAKQYDKWNKNGAKRPLFYIPILINMGNSVTGELMICLPVPFDEISTWKTGKGNSDYYYAPIDYIIGRRWQFE